MGNLLFCVERFGFDQLDQAMKRLFCEGRVLWKLLHHLQGGLSQLLSLKGQRSTDQKCKDLPGGGGGFQQQPPLAIPE